VVYKSALYFSGNDGSSGWEPWKYDGSSVALVKDINPGAGDSNPGQFAVYNGKLYFQASDGSSGAELWALTY
jgi:ELWxxDGT repeat protein